ncbi:hypothetical protein NSTC745_02728 [Nostoc sp. DSM 114161]|jgi:hypothetical protein
MKSNSYSQLATPNVSFFFQGKRDRRFAGVLLALKTVARSPFSAPPIIDSLLQTSNYFVLINTIIVEKIY